MIEYLQRQEDRLQFKTETKTVTLVPVIIVFSNDMDLTAGILDHKRDLPFPQANSFLLNELSNPIQGILASRTARSIQSYTQAIAMQQEYNHNQWFDKFRYTLEDEQQSERALDLKDFVVFKLDRDGINDTTEVPLGWWLSDTSQEYMAKKYLDSKYQPQQLIQQIKQRLDDPAVRR